jgi:hypothetical protein
MDKIELIKKLEQWVTTHPQDADTKHINLTTQKEFTMREVLEQLIDERDKGIAIADNEINRVVGEVEKWIGGI